MSHLNFAYLLELKARDSMPEEYKEHIAIHYHSYRPPLHQVILERCLKQSADFNCGLDIGSGTGQSSLAMAAYCQKVIGLEPAVEMLEKAIAHPRIKYVQLSTNNLPFANGSFDLITFAGSLFYAKSQHMLDEVQRVCCPGAVVLAYDFEILFQQLPFKFHLPFESPGYDHSTNFTGLNLFGLKQNQSFISEYSLSLTSKDLTHLLLSVESFHAYFCDRYALSDPYPELLKELNHSSSGTHDISAMLYASSYYVLKKEN